MKVIIHDRELGLYVSGPASWGRVQREAMPFENSITAWEFCLAHNMPAHRLEALPLYNDSRMETPMTLFSPVLVAEAAPIFGSAQAPSTAEE